MWAGIGRTRISLASVLAPTSIRSVCRVGIIAMVSVTVDSRIELVRNIARMWTGICGTGIVLCITCGGSAIDRRWFVVAGERVVGNASCVVMGERIMGSARIGVREWVIRDACSIVGIRRILGEWIAMSTSRIMRKWIVGSDGIVAR
jgi:hypothetical protein